MWQIIFNYDHGDFNIWDNADIETWITRISFQIHWSMDDVMVTEDLKQFLIENGGSNVEVSFVSDEVVLVEVDGFEFLCKNSSDDDEN